MIIKIVSHHLNHSCVYCLSLFNTPVSFHYNNLEKGNVCFSFSKSAQRAPLCALAGQQ